MRSTINLSIWLSLAFLWAAVYAKGVIPAQDAGSYIGQLITVSGKIEDAHNNASACFLNFRHGGKCSLTLVIDAAALPRFPLSPEKYYLNKNVQATGIIKDFNGKMEMFLTDRSEILTVNDESKAQKKDSAPSTIENRDLKKEIDKLNERLQLQESRIADLESKITRLELALGKAGVTPQGGISGGLRNRDVGYR